MRYAKILGVVAMLGVFLLAAPYASAQVRVGIGVGVGPAYVGPAPVCAYGYYPYYPYACAPYGYYGPSWFVNGTFIGAGPWFHGFYGHPGWYGRGWYGRGYYGHPGFYGRGAYGGGYRSFAGRGPVGGFRGGAAVRGGGGFHSFGRR